MSAIAWNAVRDGNGITVRHQWNAQLLVRARQWLYKNKLVIVHERAIRTLIAAAL